MQQNSFKSQPKHNELSFLDKDYLDDTIIDRYKNDMLLMIDEDLEGQSIKQNSTRKQSKGQENPIQMQVKEEYNNSYLSSSINLEDISLESENGYLQKSDDQQVWKDNTQLKSKPQNQREFNKKAQSKPIKIQQDNDSSHNRQKRIRSHQNRKIRTTVNEEKIKIMEHLFPYIINNSPYKGTVLSLKDVAKIVDLGYSTILHKYKDYRHKGQVQKGLLLKCKDIKRKYNKSLILEKFIKKALKQKQFKTAKQLANFITEKYKFNANRSIISRHLNQMQRQRGQHSVLMNERGSLVDLKREKNETNLTLRQFWIVFQGLRNETEHFYYFTVIRLYLVGGRLLFKLEDKESDFKIINLTVTATQSELIEYQPHFVNQTQVFIASNLSSLDSFAYQALYNQVEYQTQDHHLDIQKSSYQEKVYMIFPFKNSKKQFQHRQKLLNYLLPKKISILTVPPQSKIQNINFIQRWFQQHVMTALQEFSFETSLNCKQNILSIMNQKQPFIRQYAQKMLSSLSNF